jgi:hypothetical protein
MELVQNAFNDPEIQNNKSEKSRLVRIFVLKYKCILIATFAMLALFQFLFILIKSILDDEALYTKLYEIMSNIILTKNETVLSRT